MENQKSNNELAKRAKIYNLIIVDESGSMSGLEQATLSGINETIQTIQAAQKKYNEIQEHFITLVTFDSGEKEKDVRTIWDAMPAGSVEEFKEYEPCGCTPLYDAVGQSLTRLLKITEKDEDAVGVVTILTDGQENSSKEWNAAKVKKLIEELKEKGWTFSYMGSDHNVKEVSAMISITNVIEFSHEVTGAANIWSREKASKLNYFSQMASEWDANESYERKIQRRRSYNDNYYSNRETPQLIKHLEANEVFVFGSNAQGHHGGGAARTAMEKFGAQWGVGEGMQGQCYAIPTMEGIKSLEAAVGRFCQYAKEHPEKRFLVTRIGCGIAGYRPEDVAQFFKPVIELENISLPKDFWKELGLNLFE